jgi:hypothetical protein
MKWSLAVGLAVLAAQPHVSAATTSGCEGSAYVLQGKSLELVEREVAASTIAFQGEVIAVEQDPAIPRADTLLSGVITASAPAVFDQNLTFRVLHQWKGPYQVGETVSLTIPVTKFCAGLGCVFPFKIGDVTLLLLHLPRQVSLRGAGYMRGLYFKACCRCRLF